MGARRYGIRLLVFNLISIYIKLNTKVAEDKRRLPKTFEEDPKMFRSYTKKIKCSLRVKHDISEVIDIFTSEDMEYTPPESRMNFTSGVLSGKTLVYIIKNNITLNRPHLLDIQSLRPVH